MSLVSRIPESARRRLLTIIPKRFVDAYRVAMMRPYDLRNVVARESRTSRFLRKSVLRLYYPKSMVSRQSPSARWFATRIFGRRPRLHHFEIHITDHCNLNCKGCGHFSNLSAARFLGLPEFEVEMGNMARLFEVEQIFLLGGEPLLHPEVNAFVKTARRLFPATRLYLMTNGLLVTRMDDEFWTTLHETNTILLCDQYPINLPMDRINELGVTHGVTVEWTDPRGEFFKIPIDVSASQDPADSFRRCNGVNNCPMLRDGRLYPCAYIAYCDVLAERFDLDDIEATERDSIVIDEHTEADEVMRFMLKPVPWCAHCDFDAFSMFEWSRSERKLEEWVRPNTPDNDKG